MNFETVSSVPGMFLYRARLCKSCLVQAVRRSRPEPRLIRGICDVSDECVQRSHFRHAMPPYPPQPPTVLAPFAALAPRSRCARAAEEYRSVSRAVPCRAFRAVAVPIARPAVWTALGSDDVHPVDWRRGAARCPGHPVASPVLLII